MNPKKLTMVIALGLTICLTVTGLASAETPKSVKNIAEPDVKSAIEADFENYKNSLETAKRDFEVGKDASFHSARLEEGIPFWTIDREEDLQFGGYVFPIVVSGRPAGIAFAEQSEGTWHIFTIKDNLTLMADLAEATNGLGPDEQARLIYDQIYGIYAIEVEDGHGGHTVVSMRDPITIDLPKGKQVPFDKFKQKVKKVKEERAPHNKNDGEAVDAGGAAAGADASRESARFGNITMMSAGCAALIAGACLYRMRKKKFLSRSLPSASSSRRPL